MHQHPALRRAPTSPSPDCDQQQPGAWNQLRALPRRARTPTLALRALQASTRASWIAEAGRKPLTRAWRTARSAMLGMPDARAILHWFARLQRDRLPAHVQRRPHVSIKPLRPYLSLRWNRRRRIAALLDSYELAARGPAILRLALAQPGGVVIARIDGSAPSRATGEGLELCLATDYRFRKEGEWVLSLRPIAAGQPAAPLMSLAFAFRRGASGQMATCIGCVQGATGARDAIRAATRAMHGLRPATLLVLAARELALLAGASRLRAVCDQAQVHRRKHLLHIPGLHALRFDYDELWRESGGRLRRDGWFDLPLRVPHRARSEVPARKRAEHARRCLLIDDIARQLRAADTYPKPA